MGFIYIFKSKETGYYKIGMTNRTVKKRLQEFSTLPDEISEIYSGRVKYPRRIEKELHSLYKNYRVIGEWFDLSLEHFISVIEYIQHYEV
jgi:hypothetical protein